MTTLEHRPRTALVVIDVQNDVVADAHERDAVVDRIRGLVDRARTLMLVNRDRPEQTTTGSLRRGEDHWVAGRKGRPCRRCGTTILLGDQGPDLQERVTWWCPRCQTATSPIAADARTGEPNRPRPILTGDPGYVRKV